MTPCWHLPDQAPDVLSRGPMHEPRPTLPSCPLPATPGAGPKAGGVGVWAPGALRLGDQVERVQEGQGRHWAQWQAEGKIPVAATTSV